METKIKIPYQEIKDISNFNYENHRGELFYHLNTEAIDEAFPELQDLVVYQPTINKGGYYQLSIQSLDDRVRWMRQDITKKQFKFLQKKYNLK